MGKYLYEGKQVLHCDTTDNGGHCESFTHIADAKDSETAHFLAQAANDHFDYMGEADATNSTIFRPQNVERKMFVSHLQMIASVAEELNLAKKLLVRGKTREELGFEAISLHESLAPEFDPNNSSDAAINVLHGALGVITEAGEVAELLLQAIQTGHVDDVNVIEECGDLRWYIARMLRGVGKTDRDCERMNINKLRGRHGATFDMVRDANRDLAAERKRLETDAGTPLFDGPASGVNGGENIGDPIAAQIAGKPLPTGLQPPLPEPRTADMDAIAAAERSGQLTTPLARPLGKLLAHIKPLPPGGVRG